MLEAIKPMAPSLDLLRLLLGLLAAGLLQRRHLPLLYGKPRLQSRDLLLLRLPELVVLSANFAG